MNQNKNLVDHRIKITFFQRRQRIGINFSLENILTDVRKRLENKIAAEVKICRFYNDRYLSKIYNILEATFRQTSNINHVTGEVHFLNILMRKKTVLLTILDCGMVRRKKGIARWLVRIIYLTLPVRSSRYITTISKETRREIIEYTNCDPGKIQVIPVAVDEIFQPAPKAFNSQRPNILHVGLGPNKNIFRLVEALEGINCNLIVIGKLSKIHLHELQKRNISFTNYYNLSQEEMYLQYQECDILSYISIFEGFGMPIIEANCVERVVITSKVSSMPEVAANAACLVDPYNVEEIRNGILKLINDVDYRNVLLANGKQNKLRFDAAKIADTYYDLYVKMNAELLA